MVLSKDLKIAICFGLIMGAIISVCNMCLASESENVPINVVNGLYLDNITEGVRQIIEGNRIFGYVEIVPGYQYTFYNGYTGSTRIMFGDNVPKVR